ncbi:MAG: hypothetical protein R3299_12535, partial [Arenibacter sp.]|nr:hypothetical protein [Arenibacter sp.]
PYMYSDPFSVFFGFTSQKKNLFKRKKLLVAGDTLSEVWVVCSFPGIFFQWVVGINFSCSFRGREVLHSSKTNS